MQEVKQWDSIILEVIQSPGQFPKNIADVTNTNHMWIDRILFWLEQDEIVYVDDRNRWFPDEKARLIYPEEFV